MLGLVVLQLRCCTVAAAAEVGEVEGGMLSTGIHIAVVDIAVIDIVVVDIGAVDIVVVVGGGDTHTVRSAFEGHCYNSAADIALAGIPDKTHHHTLPGFVHARCDTHSCPRRVVLIAVLIVAVAVVEADAAVWALMMMVAMVVVGIDVTSSDSRAGCPCNTEVLPFAAAVAAEGEVNSPAM